MRVLLTVFTAVAVAACDRSSAARNTAVDSTPSSTSPAPAAAPVDSTPAATAADSGKPAAADSSGFATQPSASKPTAPKASAPKVAEPTFAASLGINPKELRAMPSGLKMIDVKTGNGTEAEAGHEVVVHYTGWLTDGKKFDSSRDRGEPFTFNLGAGEVIQGWDKGVAGMKVGGRRKLVIPADLGYGDNGAPPDIPPGATLVFDVELLEVH
jgi:FKBP-type peptidyl-prolyl cis-trans isomerase